MPEKIQSGELKLAQISLLQKAIRQKKKEIRTKLGSPNALDATDPVKPPPPLTPEGKSRLLDSLWGGSQLDDLLGRSAKISTASQAYNNSEGLQTSQVKAQPLH